MDLSELSLSIIRSTFTYPGDPMEPVLCEFEPFNLRILHGFSLGGSEELLQKRGQVWGKKRLFVILSRVEQQLFQFFPLLTKMKCHKAWGECPLLCRAGVRLLQERGPGSAVLPPGWGSEGSDRVSTV